ncbi:MAG: DNA translocase FtsK 4TM domain-containing protein, partial [Rubrimonas sp.]
MSDWSEGGARAPWLPDPVAGFLQRRGAELAGLALLAAGLALAVALLSYDARDPSWFVATSEPAANALGEVGALIADPLMRSLGLGGYMLAAAFAVWGGRLLTHRGAERVWSRLALVSVAAPAVAMFASAHAPTAGWQVENVGLGGLIGDMLLGQALGLIPLPTASALLAATLGLAVASLLLGGLALGLDRAETAAILRWLRFGYGVALGAAFSVGGRAAAHARARLARPRSERVAPPDPVGRRARVRREPGFRGADDDADDAYRAPPPRAARAPPRSAVEDDADDVSYHDE